MNYGNSLKRSCLKNKLLKISGRERDNIFVSRTSEHTRQKYNVTRNIRVAKITNI